MGGRALSEEGRGESVLLSRREARGRAPQTCLPLWGLLPGPPLLPAPRLQVWLLRENGLGVSAGRTAFPQLRGLLGGCVMRPPPSGRKAGLLQGPALYHHGGPGCGVKGCGGVRGSLYGFPVSLGPASAHPTLSGVADSPSEPS